MSSNVNNGVTNAGAPNNVNNNAFAQSNAAPPTIGFSDLNSTVAAAIDGVSNNKNNKDNIMAGLRAASDAELQQAWNDSKRFGNANAMLPAVQQRVYAATLLEMARRAGHDSVSAWRDTELARIGAAGDYDAFVAAVEQTPAPVRQANIGENELTWAGDAGAQFNERVAAAALQKVQAETRDAELRKWSASTEPFATDDVGQRAEEKLVSSSAASTTTPDQWLKQQWETYWPQTWFKIALVVVGFVVLVLVFALVIALLKAIFSNKQRTPAYNYY